MMLTMSTLAVLAFKSVALAGLTLALLGLARGRTPAERSLIAHLGLLAILLLPVAALALPQWTPLPHGFLAAEEPVRSIPVNAPVLPVADAQPAVKTVTATPAAPLFAPSTLADLPPLADVMAAAPAAPAVTLPTLAELVVWMYVLPLGLLVMAMTVAVFRLLGMRRRAEVLVDRAWLAALAEAQRRMGFKHGTALLVSEELRSPISWGVLRPTILLDPRAVSAVRDAEAIIAHELAHVARLDWAKLLLARAACALFWFNPLVWLLARESHQLREEAADDSVLLTDIAGADYATLLVNAARHDNRAVLIAAHGVAPAKNSLRRRIVRVLDGGARRGPVRAGWSLFSLAAVFGVAAPLAAFSVEPADRTASPRSAGAAQGLNPAPALVAATGVATAHQAAGQETDRETDGSRVPLSAEDLVSMRAVGVTPADVAQMREAEGDVEAGEIIAAKATGVTPGYIAEMRAVFGDVDASELVGARAVGVDSAYARALRAAMPEADLDTIVGARAVGVSPAYVREIRAYYPRATLDDLIGMRATGVTGAYIEQLRAAGLDVATPDDAIGVRAMTGRRGPAPRVFRAPQAVATARSGAVATIGSDGRISVRGADGSTATIHPPDPPPGHDPHDH